MYFFFRKLIPKTKIYVCTLTLQPLLFWKKQGFSPNKARVFLFAEPLKSLEKKGKMPQENKENQKKRKSKKARIGGSG